MSDFERWVWKNLTKIQVDYLDYVATCLVDGYDPQPILVNYDGRYALVSKEAKVEGVIRIQDDEYPEEVVFALNPS